MPSRRAQAALVGNGGDVAELRELAENFDEMAEAVQNDLAARRRPAQEVIHYGRW